MPSRIDRRQSSYDDEYTLKVRVAMSCPDNIAQGYGDNTEGSPLGYREVVGGQLKWFPAKCTSVVSGSGSSAIVNLEIYPEAGGTQSRSSVSYSHQGQAGKWYCTENVDPSGVARG